MKILYCLALLVFFGCATETEIVLPEVKSQKMPEVKKVPPVVAVVIEVEEFKGEQKYIYIKMTSDNEWCSNGFIGLIFNDVGMKEKIGKFKVVQIFKNRLKGEILELGYPVKPGSRVVIEVDPRFLINEKDDSN